MDTRSLEAFKGVEAAWPSNKFWTRFHDLLNQAEEEEAALGKKIPADTFKSDFCLPMKRREVWLASQKGTKFPELWPLFPACTRLERFLSSNSGRAKILNCIKAGVGLSGDPKDPDVRGIDDK